MNNLKKTISYILLPVMILFVSRSAFALSEYTVRPSSINNNHTPSSVIRHLSTKLQWYISSGKDVVGTTSGSASSEGKSYGYSPFGRVEGDSLVVGGPWPVAGKNIEYPSSLTINNLLPLRTSYAGQALTINTNCFTYSGYYLDSISGLYYLNARFYSPEFMRFISRDSFDLPNRYAYCNGDPISQLDPAGHIPLLKSIIAVGVILAVNLVATIFSDGITLPIELSLDIGIGGQVADQGLIATGIIKQKSTWDRVIASGSCALSLIALGVGCDATPSIYPVTFEECSSTVPGSLDTVPEAAGGTAPVTSSEHLTSIF